MSVWSSDVCSSDLRPSIAKLTLRGNKDIKTDDLKKGLKEIGLSEGETFDRLALDNVQQELIRQYYNRGKYNVSVEPHVTRLDRNRVAVEIEVREGQAARIQEVRSEERRGGKKGVRTSK